jgi:hypothetical protein
MESVDLLSFEYGDAVPSPYFNLEDEIAETKKKLQRLEAKYKKNKVQTKQRWKQMENRMDETVLKLKEEKDEYLKRLTHLERKLEIFCTLSENDDFVSIVPCIDPSGKLQFYDVHCSEIKIITHSQQLFLSMDGKLLCNIHNESLIQFLKQNKRMKSLKIELTEQIHRSSTLVKVCDALLYHSNTVEEGGLDLLFKCVHRDGSISIVKEMVNLFKKSNSLDKGDRNVPYFAFTLELQCPNAYKGEIDDMKAHCTANDIHFTFNEIL